MTPQGPWSYQQVVVVLAAMAASSLHQLEPDHLAAPAVL
jgi:hypothetical protein